jgi:hypothetical protein
MEGSATSAVGKGGGGSGFLEALEFRETLDKSLGTVQADAVTAVSFLV